MPGVKEFLNGSKGKRPHLHSLQGCQERHKGNISRSGICPVQDLLNLARVNSPWPLTFGIACCAIEMMAAGMARFDWDRFGIIPGALPANPTS